MKKILVPTDFSNNAYSALFYATRLFQNEACHFYILNTFEVDTPVLTSRIDTSKGNKLYQELSNKSQEKLTETLHSIVRDSEDFNHTFETISISKKLVVTINKTIKSAAIDLVVMGTKGASGVKEILMGSNTVQVIKKIKDCAILAVPDEYDFKKPTEIGFATDFKCLYTKEKLKPLLEIATTFSSNIRVMHIHEEEKLDEQQEYNFVNIKENLQNFNFCIHWIPRFTKKAKLIHQFIENMHIDMLCMSHYKHSLMESILHEPVLKKVGFHLSVPFLVIPEGD